MLGSDLLFNALIAFGAFQALFIAAILFLHSNKSIPKKFFSLFLIIEGITLFERLLAETGLISELPHLIGVSYPISFLKPPLLFFSALAITNNKFKLRRIHALHLIPFILFLLVNIPFYLAAPDVKLKVVQDFLTKQPTYMSFDFFLSLSFFFHIGSYILATLVVLVKFRVRIKNNRLANWYLRILSFYMLFLVSHFLYFTIRPSGLIDLPSFNTISMLIMTFVIQSVAYSFIIKSNILTANPTSSSFDVTRLEKDEALIKHQFETRKIYLNDGLTLDQFAQEIEQPKKYISDLINQRFGKSFKDVINQYRVEEAKRLMARETVEKVQLIDIAFESGFNNKVSFYRAFKKHTGKSPSDYLKSLKKNK